MATILDLIQDLKDLPDTIQDGIDRALLGDGVDVADINRDQLSKGIDAEGNKLGNYRESTKAIRGKKGLQTSFIDLNFTGRSVKSIDTKKVSDKKFEIVAKPRWDQQRFPDAIGITKSNEDKVTDIVIENVEAVLNQKFK